MLPIPKSRISSSWVKVKLTRQLEISQSKPITFPVTSTLKIHPVRFKARLPVPSNTDCTCQLLVRAEMGKEWPARLPLGPICWFYSGQRGEAKGVRLPGQQHSPFCWSLLLLHLMPVTSNRCHGWSLPLYEWMLHTAAFYQPGVLRVGKACQQAVFPPQRHIRCWREDVVSRLDPPVISRMLPLRCAPQACNWGTSPRKARWCLPLNQLLCP